MIITTLIFLRVFISVIISNYLAIKESHISPAEYNFFADHWAEFDPDATCYITYEVLFPFVFSLCAPLGFESKTCSRRQYSKRVGSVKVSRDKMVYFYDVLTALSRAHIQKNVDTVIGLDFESKEKANVSLSSSRKNRHKRSFHFFRNFDKERTLISTEAEEEVYTVAHYLAVDLISEVWKVRKSQRSVPVSDAEKTSMKKGVQSTEGIPEVLGLIVSTPPEYKVNAMGNESNGRGEVHVMRNFYGEQMVMTKTGSRDRGSPSRLTTSGKIFFLR